MFDLTVSNLYNNVSNIELKLMSNKSFRQRLWMIILK